MTTGITHTITYRRSTDDTIHKLEWTCPKWTRSAVRDAFYAQYAAAEIISTGFSASKSREAYVLRAM